MIASNYKKAFPYHALSLGEWGKSQGISYKTAWRMFRAGRLPQDIEPVQLPTGTIRVRQLEAHPTGGHPNAVIYARINPRQERTDLDHQISMCKSFCAAKGWIVLRTLQEVAPAVGCQRKKLNRLLDAPPDKLVISKPSILSRFDFDLLNTCLRHCRCELVVVDKSFDTRGEGGAMEDLVDAVSMTCHRHFGLKRGALMLEQFRKVIDSRQR